MVVKEPDQVESDNSPIILTGVIWIPHWPFQTLLGVVIYGDKCFSENWPEISENYIFRPTGQKAR